MMVSKRVTISDNISYPWLSCMKGQFISTIGNKVYIDGYELKNGKWKKQLEVYFIYYFKITITFN